MELNKSNMKKIMLLIAFGIAVYLGLQNLYRISGFVNFIVGILQPILLGLAFAFILNVLMKQVELHLFAPLNRRFTKLWPKARRPLSIVLTLVIVIGIIVLFLLIVIPNLVETITNLSNNVPLFFNQMQQNFTNISKAYPSVGEYISNININWSSISQMLAKYGQDFASALVGSTVTITTNVFRGALSFILGFVISINVLAQKEKLEKQLKRVTYAYLPAKFADKFIYICSLTNSAFSNFIAGQCTEACILGTLCFIGMSIFHFPYALLISVLVTLLALIPMIGSLFSVSLGALLILTVSPISAFWFIVFFLILQQIEGNLIYPRVVGSKVGLPALWVLIAVTLGANTFGIVGIIVNIPVCSVLYILLRENVKKRTKQIKLEIGPIEHKEETKI